MVLWVVLSQGFITYRKRPKRIVFQREGMLSHSFDICRCSHTNFLERGCCSMFTLSFSLPHPLRSSHWIFNQTVKLNSGDFLIYPALKRRRGGGQQKGNCYNRTTKDVVSILVGPSETRGNFPPTPVRMRGKKGKEEPPWVLAYPARGVTRVKLGLVLSA